MILEYEPASGPLYVSVKQFFLEVEEMTGGTAPAAGHLFGYGYCLPPVGSYDRQGLYYPYPNNYPAWSTLRCSRSARPSINPHRKTTKKWFNSKLAMQFTTQQGLYWYY